MKAAFPACLALAVAPFAAAQTSITRTDLHIMMLGQPEADGTTVTVGKDGVIHATQAMAPRAVKLTEDVTIGMIGTGVNFKAGDVLYGRYDDSVWTYCQITNLNAASATTVVAAEAVLTMGLSLLLDPTGGKHINCLYDSNSDGKFDGGWGGGTPMTDSAFVAFDMTPKSLSGTPGFERVDPTLGPRMPVEITWYKPKTSAAVTFRLTIAGTQVSSQVATIPAPGGDPVQVKLGGAVLLLDSYDAANETVTVTIKEGFSRRYTRVPAERVITTSYYYY